MLQSPNSLFMESIETVLASRFNKEKFLNAILSNHDKMDETFELALGNNQPVSWRAAWVLNHALSKGNPIIKLHEAKILETLPHREAGHQRELMKLLEKIEMDEELEGVLFDHCVTIWESVEKQPSVRVVAFRIISQIAMKYPEMKNEIEFLTQDHYTEGLSPGIKRSFAKILAKI